MRFIKPHLTSFISRGLSIGFCLLLFLLTGNLSAQETFSYERMRVTKIDVFPQNLGSDTSFNDAAVKTKLQTKVGLIFSQNEFDQDLKNLALEYDKIEPDVDVVNNEIVITLKIWIKPTVHSIAFCGNNRVKTSKLEKELGLKLGALFERDEFLTKLNKVKMYYLKKGYFESQLCYELIPVEGGSQVDVVINIEEGCAGHIYNIVFQGTTPAEECELRELLMTKTYNRFLSWYNGCGCFHPDLIDRDRMILLDYYQNRGFADANITFCVEETANANKIIIVITVDKGAFYTFGHVSFEGNSIFCNEDIEAYFKYATGDPFSPEKVRNTAREIRDLYGASGYIEANIDFQLRLHPDCPIYDVLVTIDEGEQYCVGMIRVFGNQCTQTKVILNESLLCPGEVFNMKKLEGTEERLGNTGYFKEVNVYAVGASTDDSNYRDVYVEVDEADTGNLGIFLGANSLDSIFGGIDITEKNFDICGLPRIFRRGPFSLRGRGEFLHLKLNIGKRMTSYLLQWTQPYFLDTPWIVGFDLEKNDNRMLSRGYELKTYGGNVHGIYIWNEFLKYDIHYRARHTRVSVRDSENLQLEEQAKITGLVSAVGATAIYDSTNNPRRPCSGLRSRLSYELAGVGGNFDFMKLGYLNSFYYPMSKKGVFKLRADLQFIHTYGHTHPTGMPLSERLFLGGETTVRGYKNFIIGPKFGSNEPAGGMSSYLISEEFQYNLVKSPCIDGFVFMDAGYVSLSQFSIGRPAASVGFGLRVEVMRNMPLTMGLGYPIHPIEILDNGQRFNNAQRFFFSIGGCF